MSIGLITGNVAGGSGTNAFGIFVEDTFKAETAIDIDGALLCGPTGVVPFVGKLRLVESSANTITMINTSDEEVVYSSSAGPVVIGGNVVRR